ncbi:hypothetical protein FOZ62_003277 [Perkinsus olseni]|uniref:Uncharacterized protein n=1 Tax=Perkinsus olseni TaxID=32597 RepID=A0A7J6U9N7_PEROL|nr:hypothetical protein FOZ62_003277 [Perkinsus olseni]
MVADQNKLLRDTVRTRGEKGDNIAVCVAKIGKQRDALLEQNRKVLIDSAGGPKMVTRLNAFDEYVTEVETNDKHSTNPVDDKEKAHLSEARKGREELKVNIPTYQTLLNSSLRELRMDEAKSEPVMCVTCLRPYKGAGAATRAVNDESRLSRGYSESEDEDSLHEQASVDSDASFNSRFERSRRRCERCGYSPGGIDSGCNEKDENEAEVEGNEDLPDLDDEVDLEEMDFDTFWKNLWEVNVDSGDNEKEIRQDPPIAELVESDPKAESVPGEESWLRRLWGKFFAKNSDEPSETISAQSQETNNNNSATTGAPAVPAVPVSAERSFVSEQVVYPDEFEPGLLIDDESIRRTERIREWLKRYASVCQDSSTHSEDFQQQIPPARTPCGVVRPLRDVTLTCYRTPLPSSFTDDHAREIRMSHNGKMHDGSLRRS